MMSVSLDDAWGDSTNLSGMVPLAPPPSPTAVHSPPRPGAKRSGRRGLLSDEAGTGELDLEECVASLRRVSTELHEMRTLFSQQQREQKLVLYVAVGIVLLLLLFTAHSYSRLQYASECLMHWRR